MEKTTLRQIVTLEAEPTGVLTTHVGLRRGGVTGVDLLARHTEPRALTHPVGEVGLKAQRLQCAITLRAELCGLRRLSDCR